LFFQNINTNFTANTAGLFAFVYNSPGYYPEILINTNWTSMIILNLPDNTTLQAMHTGGNPISDYDMLFTYGLNPFQYEGTESEPTYAVNLTVNDPQNTTYINSTIPIDLTVTTNGTASTIYNIQFPNGTWLYESNQTYTSATTATINENTTNAIFCALSTISEDSTQDYKTVTFSVAIPAESEPEPTTTATPPPT
jgi:hypothetical protein